MTRCSQKVAPHFRRALALALAACAAGCGPAADLFESTETPAQPPESETSAPADDGVVPDRRIAAALRRELSSDAIASKETIGVVANDGVVTLAGSVPSLFSRSRAIALAHVVRGVRAVVDNLDVTPLPRPDYELESVARSVLGNDPVTEPAHIEARSHKEVVTLSGSIDSNASRRAAENDILAIPGVRGVDDELALVPARTGDAHLREEAKRAVGEDPWIDGSRVVASADRGIVSLSGWVGSAGQRRRAFEDASAALPRAVDASNLRIDAFTDDGTLRARAAPTYSDGAIGGAVLDAYVQDSRMHPFVPTVDVKQGVIVLSGVAPNAAVAHAADEDAHNVSGVRAVLDHLKTADAVAPAREVGPR